MAMNEPQRSRAHGGASLASMPLPELLFYTAFLIHSFCLYINFTTFQSFGPISKPLLIRGLEVVVFFLLVLKLLCQRSPREMFLLLGLSTVVGIASQIASDENWIFWAMIFIVCSAGIRFRPLIKLTLWLNVPMTLITFAACNLGLINDIVSPRYADDLVNVIAIRHAYGFSHANALGADLLVISVSFSALRLEKSPWLSILVALSVAVVNYLTADSRGALFTVVFEIVLLIVFHFARGRESRRRVSVALLVVVLTIIAFSYYFMFFFDATNPVHCAIDLISSNRLSLAHRYWLMHPFTLFGAPSDSFSTIFIGASGQPLVAIDNGYCHMYIRNGAIGAALYIAGIIALFVFFARKRAINQVSFGASIMCFYGLFENMGLYIEYNYFLLGIGIYLLFRYRRHRTVSQGVRGGQI